MDFYTFLIITHMLGTILAVGAATLAEVHINRSLKVGNISMDEGSLLYLDYSVLRTGFIISVVSGFGFLLSQ